MRSQFIQSIASQSLGRAWHHSFERKVRLAAQYGFKAIEIYMEDLEYLAKDLPKHHQAAQPNTTFNGSTMWDEQRIAAATFIHDLCVELALDVICLQPFMHYDGLIDRNEHESRLQQLRFWILLAQYAGTDLIQIPSSFLSEKECTGDRTAIISDLREAADIGLAESPPIRFAYEALCWGTHINRWDDAWAVVKAVNRSNFGTCIDTFNLAGGVYADPASTTGKTSNADVDIAESIEKIRKAIDISKVFYVEACDGERLDTPMSSSHDWHVEGQAPRMTWSRNARLFPFEEPGYLPVMPILEALVDQGYTGYIAFELFSRTANMADESVPEEHARRGQASWNKIMQHLEDRDLSQVDRAQTGVDSNWQSSSMISQPTLARL